MTIPRLLATAALAAWAVVPVTVASPAAALSCAAVLKVIADAEQVYAGRIIDGRDSHILVNVTEVWKGGPVEEEVWLAVEAEHWTPWTGDGLEIPDGYSSPKTWVFAPSDASEVGLCSAWSLDQALRNDLLPHRPDQPQAPVARDAPLQDARAATPMAKPEEWSGWPLVVGVGGGAVVLMVVVVGLVAGRHRSVA